MAGKTTRKTPQGLVREHPTLFTGVDLVTLFRSLPAVDDEYLKGLEDRLDQRQEARVLLDEIDEDHRVERYRPRLPTKVPTR